jgi:hypothetical protein
MVPRAAAVCYAKKKGQYSNASCTTKSSKPHKGKYETTGGPKFTSEGGASLLVSDFVLCIHNNQIVSNFCHELYEEHGRSLNEEWYGAAGTGVRAHTPSR